MADRSDFKRGQIVGARMAGARVTKIARLFGVAKSTVSKAMTAFEKEGKTSAMKRNSGRKQKQSEWDRGTLTSFVRKDHQDTVWKITAELNDRQKNPVSSKNCKKGAAKSRNLREACYQKT